jgi:hypothetical protein
LPSPSIFSYIAKSADQMAFMSPAALLNGNVDSEVTVIQEQCAYHTPEPMFLVPTGKAQKRVDVAGRLEEGPNFRVLEYRNVLMLGLYSAQQFNSWPVSMVALSDFPRAYLEDRLAVVAATKLDNSEQKQLTHQYALDSQKLENTVARIERSYDPSSAIGKRCDDGGKTLKTDPHSFKQLRRFEQLDGHIVSVSRRRRNPLRGVAA